VASSAELDPRHVGKIQRLPVDVPGRGDVLDREAQRLEEGDLRRVAAAADLPDQDLSDLPEDVVVADGTLLLRDQEVAGLVHGRLAAVDEEAGADDSRRVELPGEGNRGSDRVDVRP